MAVINSSKQITTAIIIFAIVLFILVLVVFWFGKKYRSNISSYENPNIQSNINLEKATDITSITFQKEGEPGCIEVTPDGQVKIFTTCGKDLETAYRTTNNRNINRLFELIKSGKLSTVKFDGAMELSVNTNKGRITYYIKPSDTSNNGNPNSKPIDDQIIIIIDTIIDDKPENTPTPTNVPDVSPTDTYSSPTPSQYIYFYNTATPTPREETEQQIENSFVCDFTTTDGSKKPYRVSNVVCTNEPQIAP